MPLFQIPRSEARPVILSLIYATLNGMAQMLVIAVPLAMFLSRYSGRMLPYVYFGVGAVTLLMGFLFTRAQRVLSLFGILAAPQAFLSLSLIVFWLFLVFSNTQIIFVFLMIWSLVVFVFLNTIMGGLMNTLFTLQQGKRVFGMISGGQALGGAAAGICLPLLQYWIGAQQIILLIAFLLLGGLAVQYALKRVKAERLFYREKESPVSIKKLRSKHYIFLIFLLIGADVFESYALDMIFSIEAKRHFVTQAELVNFFGLFFAGCNIAQTIVAIFLFDWILEKFGVIVALLILPCIIASVTIFLIGASVIPAMFSFIFMLLVVNRFFDEVIHLSINEDSLLLLFQPLRPQERIWVQIQNEGSVSPIATSLIGLVLIGIDRLFGLHILNISVLLLVICGCMVAVTLILKKDYLKALVMALSKRIFYQPMFTTLDQDALSRIQDYLKSPIPEEVLFALETLELAKSASFEKALLQAMDHPAEQVRLFALQKIEEHRVTSALQKITKMLWQEKGQMLASCVRAYGMLGGQDAALVVKNYLEDKDPRVVLSSLIALLKGSANEEAKRKVMQLANSPLKEEKIQAAEVLKEVSLPEKKNLLLELLLNSDKEIQIAAMRAITDVDEQLMKALFEKLKDHSLQKYTFPTLLFLGSNLLEFIAKEIDHYTFEIQKQLVKLLGYIQQEKSVVILQKFFPHQDRRLFHQAMISLRQLHFKPSYAQKKIIREQLSVEKQFLEDLEILLRDLNLEHQKILKGLLSQEVELSQERMFLLLSFSYSEELMTAYEGMSSNNEDLISYSMEVLQRILSPEDQKAYFEPMTFSPRQVKGSEEEVSMPQDVASKLLRILQIAPECAINAISSAAVFTIGAMKLKALKEHVKKAANEKDPYIQEIVPWSLNHLN